MKLTMTEVEAKLTAAWKREVFIVPYRLAGNRYTYTAGGIRCRPWPSAQNA